MQENKVVQFVRKYYYFGVILIAVVVKMIILSNLPLFARDPSGADEYLMMYQAEQLASGNYLGPYNYLTLVKGIGFPVFLALSYRMGIPLLVMYGSFYTIACLLALVPIRRMIKKRPIQLIVFLILLFCPASMDTNVQMIYRNMLIIPQSMILVSALMMVYYHANGSIKKLVGWSLLASFIWVFMWHTREDTIWSVPLVAAMWLIVVIAIIKKNRKKPFDKNVIRRVAILSLPIVFLVMSIHLISFINYQHYGVYTTNQLNNSNYTKAVMLITKIKPEEEKARVTITHDTIRKIYDVSPTFAMLRPYIEKDYQNTSGLVTAGEANGEINEDLITWELTGAASSAGYYKDAQTAENFWDNVYEEIKNEVDGGKFQTRAIMPSRSLIPFPQRTDSMSRLLSAFGELLSRTCTYHSSTINVDVSKLSEETTRRYEAIAGGYAVRDRTQEDVADPIELRATKWVNYANKVRKVYVLLTPIMFVLGMVYYLGLTIVMIVKAKKRERCYFDRWLLLSMSLGGALAIMLGLTYVEAFMVSTIGYLASLSGLFNLFIAFSFGLMLQDVISLYNFAVLRRRKHH